MENTNRLLRQYLGKSDDLNRYTNTTSIRLSVAEKLDTRPRQVPGPPRHKPGPALSTIPFVPLVRTVRGRPAVERRGDADRD